MGNFGKFLQLQSTKPVLKFCTGSNPTHRMAEIREKSSGNVPSWKKREITPFTSQP